MPRNVDGSSSVPSGNPVVSGTAINSAVHNNTVADIYSMLADSLSRSGKGGMTAPFQHLDGSAAAPGISFGSETTTGLYRAAAGQVGLAILGTLKFLWKATGIVLTGDLSFDKSSTTTVGTTTANDLSLQTNSNSVLTLKSAGEITLDRAGVQTISKGNGALTISTPGSVIFLSGTAVDVASKNINNVASPVGANDAATKGYIDSKYGWAKITAATGAIARSGGGLSIASSRGGTGVFTITATNIQNGALVGTVLNAASAFVHITSESSNAMIINVRDLGDALRDRDFFVQVWVP